MTLIQIEKRVKALEQTVHRLARQKPSVSPKWYRSHAGRFAGDPVFDEIVKLGRTYRKAQRPTSGSKRVIILDTDVLSIVQRGEGHRDRPGRSAPVEKSERLP